MKRLRLKPIIIFVILLFITIVIIMDIKKLTPWYSDKPLDKNRIQSGNIEWMNYIRDSIDIRELSIPGTHDSCASDMLNPSIILWFVNDLYKCQSWSIEEQLFAGIRYFDLRPAGNGIIYHGFGKTRYSMKSVFKIFHNFLNEHQSEGLIVRIQFSFKKYGDNLEKSKEKEIFQVLENYNDILYTDNDFPTVRKLRKKILVILDKLEYRSLLTWENKDLIKIQDYYSLYGIKKLTLDKKSKLVKKYMYNNDQSKLIINHCSGVGRGILSTIGYVAYTVNKIPYKEIGFRGILIFDFPGEDLINHVINQNKPFFKLS